MAHIKRIAAPRSWPIERKGQPKLITKQSPGPHLLKNSLPLLVVVRDLLKYVDNKRQMKRMLTEGKVKVNGVVRKDTSFPVGTFDILEFPSISELYTLLLNKKGKLALQKITGQHNNINNICKIMGKTILKKKKCQLNLYNGWNIIVADGSYKVGDSLIVSGENKKIIKHLKLEKGAMVFLTAGKHVGIAGVVHEIKHFKGAERDRIVVRSGNETLETLKDYAYVIEKPFT